MSFEGVGSAASISLQGFGSVLLNQLFLAGLWVRQPTSPVRGLEVATNICFAGFRV